MCVCVHIYIYIYLQFIWIWGKDVQISGLLDSWKVP